MTCPGRVHAMKTRHFTIYSTLSHGSIAAHAWAILVVMIYVACIEVQAQTTASTTSGTGKFTAPYNSSLAGNALVGAADSILLPFASSGGVPYNYEQLLGDQIAGDLATPSNITTTTEYDPATRTYILRTRVGDLDIATPLMLSERQYNSLQQRHIMQQYYQQRNSEAFQGKEKDPFNPLDMHFAIGPLEKIFGPGGVQLRTQGSVQIKMGIKSNKTDNPSLSLNARRKTYFDFEQKIQANVNASVGDRLKFNLNYNTDATFDFDSKNLKLAYEGKEDDIVKSIEAGNVSLTTGSSLIRGSTALFGIKSKLQFGRLTATALVSQQNSESRTVNTKGGAQLTPSQSPPTTTMPTVIFSSPNIFTRIMTSLPPAFHSSPRA